MPTFADKKFPGFNKKLKDFERAMAQWYPLGIDSFKIDHGPDYCLFFRRLGGERFVVSQKNNKIVGTLCAIERRIMMGKNSQKGFWYLCDLKVDPRYRRQGIASDMLLKMSKIIRTTDGIYAISMNNGKKNTLFYLLEKMSKNFYNTKMSKDFYNTIDLFIYSLDFKTMIRILPIIHKYRGDIWFVNMQKLKDLRLKSTNSSMKLLHMQWENNCLYDLEANTKTPKISYPQENFTHMFCCPKNDPLHKALTLHGIETSIGATILSHNMKGYDWSFIQTCDI